jgi:hypothetical protein
LELCGFQAESTLGCSDLPAVNVAAELTTLKWTFLTEFPEYEKFLPSSPPLCLSWLSGRIFLEKRGRGKIAS